MYKGPTIISDYIIGDFIGAGQEGQVYKCRKKEKGVLLPTTYAVKIIPASKAEIKTRLAQERNIGQTCNHPNIMKIYDLYFGDDFFYMITEYCSMGTLKNYIKGKILGEEQSISILKGICKGYEELNKNSIVHQDMKTENILLSLDKGIIIPKISDFGSAQKQYELSMSMTKIVLTEGGLGTPIYMSPEVIEGENFNYQADIFSIGCIFYEMLFRQHPFNGATLGKIKSSLCKGDFEMDTTQISMHSAEFILGCLQYDVKSRYHMKDVINSFILNVPYMALTKFTNPEKHAKFSIHSKNLEW